MDKEELKFVNEGMDKAKGDLINNNVMPMLLLGVTIDTEAVVIMGFSPASQRMTVMLLEKFLEAAREMDNTKN